LSHQTRATHHASWSETFELTSRCHVFVDTLTGAIVFESTGLTPRRRRGEPDLNDVTTSPT
jgi:hypothetical protein